MIPLQGVVSVHQKPQPHVILQVCSVLHNHWLVLVNKMLRLGTEKGMVSPNGIHYKVFIF